MAETPFYAVLKVDGQVYAPAGHNLSVEKAEAKVFELRGKDIAAHILLQTGFHKGHGFKACKLCQNAAQNFSEQDRKNSFWKNF